MKTIETGWAIWLAAAILRSAVKLWLIVLAAGVVWFGLVMGGLA